MHGLVRSCAKSPQMSYLPTMNCGIWLAISFLRVELMAGFELLMAGLRFVWEAMGAVMLSCPLPPGAKTGHRLGSA